MRILPGPASRPAPLLAALLAFAGMLLASARAEEPAPAAPPRVLEHDLTVRLLPQQHALVAEDRLTVDGGTAGGELVLTLAPTLGLTRPVEVAGKPDPTPARVDERITGLVVPPGRSTVVLRYAGVLFDAVQKAGDLTWVAGDGTRGLISEKGVYLAGSSAWVPRGEGEVLARYAVKAYVPEPFHVVTQGTVPRRGTLVSAGDAEAGDGPTPQAAPPGHRGPTTTWSTLEAQPTLPTDSLTLVAGPYHTQSRVVEGVTIATWFYEAEARDAPLWLDAMGEVVKRYARLLGPYPHPKFDIVTNFFQTGYGMPSFTLLGDEVLRYVTMGAKRPGGKIPPGYLDHEYVHGWYGNGLFVDYARGNWCEGLTTYCSNYWAKELESAAEALAHRRGVLERFSLRVKGAKDQPVRRFVQKTEDTDNDIGYGKASLIFHLARRALGDKPFWKALKDLTQARVGTVVSWDDWLDAFDAAAGRPVSATLRPYLERPGLPGLAGVRALVGPAADGRHRVTLVAEQTPASDGGGPWPLTLEVALEGVVGPEKALTLDLSLGRAEQVVEVATPPRRVVFDGGYHALRRIAEADLPPCLERTFAAAGADAAEVVVLAGGAEQHFRPLAEQIAATKGFRVEGPGFDLAAHRGPALVLGLAPAGQRTLTVGGTSYDDPKAAALVSTVEGGRARSVFTALSEEAAARAGRLPFYAWDPWVVFVGGRPVARAPRTDEAPGTVVVLDAGPGDAAGRVKADLEQLCAPAFEGRRPGSKGHALCREWLGERLKAWAGGDPGRTTLVSRFEIGQLERRSPRSLSIVPDEGGATVLEDAFRPFSFCPPRDPELQPPQSCEVVPWSGTDPLALAQDANGRSSGIVAYVLTAEAEAALAPFLDVVGDLTPTAARELEKPGRDGKPRPRPPLGPWIAGRRARLAPGLAPVDRTVIAVGAAGGERLAQALEAESRVQLAVDFAPPVEGATLVASSVPLAPAGRGPAAPRPPVVVLMAHYDSFGLQDGALWVGADDNASGVSCLLEVLRSLPAAELAPAAGLPGVVVVLTDGEEWGLRGAAEAVEDLRGLADVRAVVNVDAVGRSSSRPTHVIGLSRHPALGALVKAALEQEGVALGKDIDAFAYDHGSDHWPFHLEGIPAVTLWATDYAVMNAAGDTPEKVEPAGVARLAASLVRLLREQRRALGALEPAR